MPGSFDLQTSAGESANVAQETEARVGSSSGNARIDTDIRNIHNQRRDSNNEALLVNEQHHSNPGRQPKTQTSSGMERSKAALRDFAVELQRRIDGRPQGTQPALAQSSRPAVRPTPEIRLMRQPSVASTRSNVPVNSARDAWLTPPMATRSGKLCAQIKSSTQSQCTSTPTQLKTSTVKWQALPRRRGPSRMRSTLCAP